MLSVQEIEPLVAPVQPMNRPPEKVYSADAVRARVATNAGRESFMVGDECVLFVGGWVMKALGMFDGGRS